jgi:hypothetical protein
LRLLKTGTGGSLIPVSKTREEVVLWIWNIKKLELAVIIQMKYPPNTVGDNLGKMLILFSWENRKPRPYFNSLIGMEKPPWIHFAVVISSSDEIRNHEI